MTGNVRRSAVNLVVILMLVLGLVLLGLNLYGLTQPLRKPGLGVADQELLRFVPDQVWDYETSLSAIDALAGAEGDMSLAEQANDVVHQSLVHVKWTDVDPVAYRQLVPPWENVFLWAVGRFSGLPQFERYHYADYRRSIERGIGICGDASIVLSSVLERYSVESDIISFRGHVIVEYENPQGQKRLLDPDFGVVIDRSLDELKADPEVVGPIYLEAGYGAQEVDDLVSIYSGDYAIFDDAYGFMSRRYLFEKTTYILKWALPPLLILPAIALWFWRRRRGSARR
ncbi:hypothetical protein ACFOZ5_05580 [Marinobacter lacisalsi]|uniref:Transglutaminase-like domain-containing protein n=1 Tax=Marinobacter lacisalsi TaxID=475979 RepID=A0ABV8QDS1_9GAMM